MGVVWDSLAVVGAAFLLLLPINAILLAIADRRGFELRDLIDRQRRSWRRLSRRANGSRVIVSAVPRDVVVSWEKGSEPEFLIPWLIEQLPPGAEVMHVQAEPRREVWIRTPEPASPIGPRRSASSRNGRSARSGQ